MKSTRPLTDSQMNEYLSGSKLYGDDFNLQELESFYKEEQDAYYDLFIHGKYKPFRNNDYLHTLYGFQYIRNTSTVFQEVLGFGSGDGRELAPLLDQITHLTILESSEKYFNKKDGYQYMKASISGDLPFASNRFDLIVSFATLHHIANVSKVISELYRCLKPGGYCLIKEPIVSMGDWRYPRKGCTKNERGIPIRIFDHIILENNFTVLHKHYHEFPLVSKLWTLLSIQVFNNRYTMALDKLLSFLFSFNTTYHRTSLWEKLGPCYVFYVLKK